MDMALRPVTPLDQPRWRALYEGYCDFYATPLTDEKAAAVWGWLLDPAHVLEGRMIDVAGATVGLVHFRAFPITLAGADGGFLDDLFVAAEHRRSGAAGFALRELVALARERDWVCLQWLTADSNAPARSVYDRLATRTHWLTYEVDLTS